MDAFATPPPLRFSSLTSSTLPTRRLRPLSLITPFTSTLLVQVRPTMTVPSPLKPYYRIGTPGQPWGAAERALWSSQTIRHRSYKAEVLDALPALASTFQIILYATLNSTYPLNALVSKSWSQTKPTVLVTGGVHGYETSGVQGALLFAATRAADFIDKINLVVIPCVTPWAYEHIQRWNADILDPNRSFKDGGTTDESRALLTFLDTLDVEQWACHIDLHETTDTDESEFMPAKAAEAGKESYTPGLVPDGFYLVADSPRLNLEWQEQILDAVRKVTHIAPSDENGSGRLIGVPVTREGIIQFPAGNSGLCMTATNAKFATTTEVYPDSPKATDEICNRAQDAAVVAAIEGMLKRM